MKRLMSALLLGVFMTLTMFPALAHAGDGVDINETNFPDNAFREYVEQFDTSGDNKLSPEELNAVAIMYVNSKGIKDLKGIEHFTELTKLDCCCNQITYLDVTKNLKLEYLDCSDNELTSFDADGNVDLTYLDCSDNRLVSIDVANNTSLEKLYCSMNGLTSLDVTKNAKLERLSCFENQLTSLDVTKNPELSYLVCSENKLKEINVTQNTELTGLYCYLNSITTLDVTKNTLLTDLVCFENQLMTLDVTKNTELTELICFGNQLTSLDLTHNTKLTSLNLGGQNDERQKRSVDVGRTAEGSWSCDLSELVGDWSNVENVDVKDASLSGKNVTWGNGAVRPEVTYDYKTGCGTATMGVTLTLVPVGLSADASLKSVSVMGVEGTISGTDITVVLPSGAALPKDAKQISVVPADANATVSVPAMDSGGSAWTFTVIAENGTDAIDYTLYVSVGESAGADNDGTADAGDAADSPKGTAENGTDAIDDTIHVPIGESAGTVKEGTVDTGDAADPLIWIVLMIMAVALTGGTVICVKKYC